MGERYILAIDQGTSSTKGLLVSAQGEILQKVVVPVDCSYPQPGWV